jgi:hypothetical protein
MIDLSITQSPNPQSCLDRYSFPPFPLRPNNFTVSTASRVHGFAAFQSTPSWSPVRPRGPRTPSSALSLFPRKRRTGSVLCSLFDQETRISLSDSPAREVVQHSELWNFALPSIAAAQLQCSEVQWSGVGILQLILHLPLSPSLLLIALSLSWFFIVGCCLVAIRVPQCG